MGRMSRNKGAAFEREIAARFAALSDRPNVKRRLGQARDSGHDLDGTEPYVVECKRRARISVYAWYAQVLKAAAGRYDAIPVVVMRQDKAEPLALLSLTDLLALEGAQTVLRYWLSIAESKGDALAEHVKMALDELGVPQAGYPAPVANAVGHLRAALAAAQKAP